MDYHKNAPWTAIIFCRHRSLQCFQHGRGHAAVILKLLGTVMNPNAGPFEYVFVIGTLVHILKATPATNVVHQ